MKRLTRRKLMYFIVGAVVLTWCYFIYTNTLKKKAKPTSMTNLGRFMATEAHTSNRFSATQALDDLYAARDTNQDFLTIFLGKDFPESISDSDLVTLQKELDELENRGNSPSINYKRGMNLFFLALSETKLISQGRKLDPAVVQGHWKSALANLQKCGDLQPWMAIEVERILRESDRNSDQSLSHDELASIISTHNLYTQP